jgi:Big-like domain-containing protein
MVSITMQQRRRIAFLMVAMALTGTAGCVEDHWNDAHAAGTRLLATIPECPQTWDTMPVFPVKSSSGNRIAGTGTTTMVLGSSALKGPGPITDVPEFHDCQKFIIPAAAGIPAHYDALYAIFAHFKLDSIVGALPFDPYTWRSSNTAVATVNASGRVTGIASGTAVIIATSTADSTRKAALAVTVHPGAPAIDSVPVIAPGAAVVGIGASFRAVAYLGAPTALSLPVAEIYTYGPGYPPLGIGPNFNCLHLYFNATGNLSAKMVQVDGAGDNACSSAVDPKVPGGMQLHVIRTAGLGNGDYPAVARWDWDSVNNQQYIGIKCGAAWCEIGASGVRPFTVSASHAPEGTTVPRVLAVKGWYDEQFLAIKRDGQMVPSGLKGIVIPDPDLAAKHQADFANGWVPVAYVGLDATSAEPDAAKYYKEKFNFDAVPAQLPLTRMNMLSLCYGTRSHCRVPRPIFPPAKGCGPDQKLPFIWSIKRVWVKLESASKDKVMYRCVTRRDHLADVTAYGILTPATTRWRWLASDETTWDYCDVAGCCETNGDGVSVGW